MSESAGISIEEQSKAKSTALLRQFIPYLLSDQLISQDQLSKVVRFRSEMDPRIGMIAAMKGFMTLEQVFVVLAEQRTVDKRFGQIAEAMNQLTEEQINEVLIIQKNPFRLFLECMKWAQAIEPTALQQAVSAYLQVLKAGPQPKVAAKQKTPPSDLTETKSEEEEQQEADVEIKIEPPNKKKKRTKEEIAADKELDKAVKKMAGDGETKVKRKDLRARLKKIKDLATMPAVIEKTLQLIDDPESELQDVGNLLRQDVALSGQILKLVNSAFFGVRGEISTISQAVLTLGFKSVRQVVTATLVLDKFQKLPKEKVEEIWWHTMLTSQWSKWVARKQKVKEVEDAVVAGLMHDVGRPILLQNFTKDMERVEKQMAKGTDLSEAEKDIFGMSHSEIGAFLTHFWNFPPQLVDAVQNHHLKISTLQTMRSLNPVTKAVSAACYLSNLAPKKDDIEEKMAQLPEEFLVFHELRGEEVFTDASGVLEEANRLSTALWS